MKRKKFLALTLAAAMSLALFSGCSRPSASSGGNDNPSANNTGSTSSEEPIVIKIGHTDSDTRSTHKWSVWLGEWLEEQAPGRFKVEVYPNGQLGDSPDMVAGVKLGTLTMEFDLSSVVSSVSGPATSAVDLPYLYPTYEDWVQGTFENGGLELFNETLAPSGYYCVGMFYNGMRQVISRTSTYHNSEDLHGQKIRVAQNDLDIKTWDDRCTHCGRCVKLCPTGAIVASDELRTDAAKCIRCCACVKGCPVGARSYDSPFAPVLSRNFAQRKRNLTLM